MSSEQKPSIGKKTKARRTWTQRGKLALWIVLGLFAALRLSLYVLLPFAMHRAAAYYDMDCTYDRIDLSLLGGDAGVWGLKLKARGGGDVLVKTDYARAKIKPWKLLVGRLDVERLEADGADLLIEREASGRMPLVEKLLNSATSGASSGGKPIDLSAPLKVDATRVTHLRARFRDEHVAPVFETTVSLDLRITDMGSSLRPTQFEAVLAADKLVDVVRIDGDVKSGGRVMDAHMNFFMRGLKLKPVTAYLSPWGIRPMADDISMRFKAHVTTGPAAGGGPGLQGVMTIEGGRLTADGVEQMGLDSLTLEAQSVDAGMAKFSRLVMDGVRGRVGRSADGYLRVGGIDFLRPAAKAAAATMPAGAAPGATAFRWELGEFGMKHFKASFHDEAVKPAADVGVEFDAIEALYRGGAAPGTASVIDVKATGRAPGLAGGLSAEGTITPFGKQKVLAVKLKADEVRGDAIKPYLDALGLESTLKSGVLTTSVETSLTLGDDGVVSGDAHLTDTRMTDGAVELFGLKDVRVVGVGVDAVNGRVKVGSVDIKGPKLLVRREADGEVAAMGLRTKAGAVRGARVDGGGAAGGGLVLPRVEVGRFTWGEIGLVFEDSAVIPRTTISLSDAGVEIRDLLVDLDAPRQSGKTGMIKMWASAPGLMETLSAQGTVTPGEHSVGTRLAMLGKHINAALLGPYLKGLGIEPTLRDGDLRCELMASVKKKAGGVMGDVMLSNVRLADGEKELASVKRAAVQGVSATMDAVRIGKIEVISPRVSAAREADGTLATFGVRTMVGGGSTLDGPSAGAGSGGAVPPHRGATVKIDQVSVSDGALAWRDAVPPKAVDTIVSGSVDVKDISLGAPGVALVHVAGKVAGAVDSATADGSISLEPENLRASLVLEARGVRAGSLEGYVPAGVAVTLTDGHLKAKLNGFWQKNPDGGGKGALEIADLLIANGESATPLLTAESVGVHVKRFDMDQRLIDIDDIVAAGVETDVHRTEDGLIEAAGVRIGGAVPEPMSRAYHKISLDGPPLVRIGQIDLRARRVGISDDSLPAPIVLRDMAFRSVAAVECLGRDAAVLPPAKFVLSTNLEPVAKQVQADISVAPFAAQPMIRVQVTATGVSGAGLAAVAPILNRAGEVGGLTDGIFKISGGIVLRMDRRSPLDFVFSRPFEANVWMKNVGFQATGDGPVLAGVKAFTADGIQVDPIARVVAFKTVEVTDPVGRIALQEGGVQAMGMLFKLPGTAGTRPAGPPTAIVETAPSAQTGLKSSAGASWEIRMNKLLVSGIDAVMEDQRVSPPLVIPLTGLEFEASNLTSKMLTQRKEFRFSMLANAGKVTLTKADGSGPEERELFSQVVGSGKMSIYPRPAGWVKLALNGMELEALSGEAARMGFSLTRGQFDGTIDARFRGDGTGRLQMRLVLTDVRVSEPAGGPIQRTLNAAAPLDGIIQVMEDPDGSITVPLELSLTDNQLSPGAVAAAIPGAVSHVVLTAIASAPIKSVNSLFGASAKKAERLEPITITFAPGVATLDENAMAQLQALVTRLSNDRSLSITLTHEVGAQDVVREAERSSPSVADTLSMVAQLRDRKERLSRTRLEITGRARGQLASRFDAGAQEALGRLKAIDREIAQGDDALEAVADLLKPGAQRQANRRTRAATLELSKERLTALRAVLMAARIPGANDRVQLTVPAFKPVEGTEGGRIVITFVRTR